MTKTKIIGYLRVSPKVEDIDNRIDVMTNETQAALYIERGIRGNVALEERSEFQKAYAQLKVGDTLLIWWMTDFGLGFKLAYDVITELLNKGIIVRTYHQNLTFKPNDEQTDTMLRLIKGYEEIETYQRLMAAELGRRKLKGNPSEWQAKFKGRRANHELHQKIAQLLTSNKTLQAIADETGASISTVKRVKAKLQNKTAH
ncbi:MAG: recombinase family protein [Vibrio litoralis]|uniref:recombinase family protein n=1 Tax=Vibrio litoralis TaxID=335972 RepID=UPI003F9B1F97